MTLRPRAAMKADGFLAVMNSDPNATDSDGVLLRHKDPRPDLRDDHPWWVDVLTTALDEDKKVWGVLHGLRCAGARIRIVGGKLGLKIDYSAVLPVVQMTDAELRERWLIPYMGAIKRVFAKVTKEASSRR